LTFKIFRRYILTIFSSWISFWISFSIGYKIAFLMNGAFVESTIAGIISGLLSGLIVAYITYKVIEHSEIKRTHKKELSDNILKELQHISIVFRDFKLQIDNLDKLKNQEDLFKWTFQHLGDKHPNISTNFKITKNSIVKLNLQIENLKKYISNKINNEIGEQYGRKILNMTENMMEIIQKGKMESLDEIEIKSDERGVEVNIKSNNILYIPSTQNNLEKYFDFLLKLNSDEKFQCYIKDIIERCENLSNAFNRYSNNLRELIKNIDNRSINEFKGKCNYCSILKDY